MLTIFISTTFITEIRYVVLHMLPRSRGTCRSHANFCTHAAPKQGHLSLTCKLLQSPSLVCSHLEYVFATVNASYSPCKASWHFVICSLTPSALNDSSSELPNASTSSKYRENVTATFATCRTCRLNGCAHRSNHHPVPHT